MRARLLLGALVAALLQPGCRPEPGERSGGAAPAAEENPVVARVGDETIRADELDAPLRLALHDLERARYELRLRRLRELVAARAAPPGAPSADAARVEILLPEPEPPRLEVDAAGAPRRGSADAAVAIVEFLDFESPHCRRMQPVLRRILEAYPGEVSLAVRDLPLPYHRNARRAALAAACAREQGAYWEYHDLLLHEQAALGREDLLRYAERLALDPDRLAACLDAERFADAVAADARAARLLGVRSAPTFFVNGAYLKGPRSYAELAAFVDRELGRETRAPSAPMAEATLEEALRALDAAEPGSPLPALPPELVPEPDAVLDLARPGPEAALRDRARLEQSLRPAPGVHDGRRLLQVAEARPGSLVDRLSLRPGDVLLLVDGEWVTDDRNSLWQALAERDEVTLVLFRGARRWVIRYVIE